MSGRMENAADVAVLEMATSSGHEVAVSGDVASLLTRDCCVGEGDAVAL